MLKFGRSYELSIETAYGTIVVKNPLTLDFAIRRQQMASAADGNFRIYNLGIETRNKIYRDRFDFDSKYMVTLKAGYGTQLVTLFHGFMWEAKSYREEGSTNVITEIDAFDGGFDMHNSLSEIALFGPRTQLEVIYALIKGMKNTNFGKVSVGFKEQYLRGVFYSGNTWQKIQDVTGQRAFIFNNQIFCLTDDDFASGPNVMISADTGLLGSPRRAKQYLEVDMLFEPRLVLGQQATLASVINPIFNGTYRVCGIQHYGTISDAVGGKCKTHVSLFVGGINFSQELRNLASLAGAQLV